MLAPCVGLSFPDIATKEQWPIKGQKKKKKKKKNLPHLLSCMRGTRNVREKMHVIEMIMKICAQCSTVYGLTNSDAGGI